MATARAGRLRSEYVDSGDDSLLQQQAEVVGQIRNAVAVIQRLTADNAQQQANCKLLDELKERRIALHGSGYRAKEEQDKSTPAAQAAISRQSLATAERTDSASAAHVRHRGTIAGRTPGAGQPVRPAATAAILLTSLFLALVLFIVHHRLLMDQVTARSRAEFAQRALSAKLLTLQDEERRKFARELHDSVGQHLAAMKMAISVLQNKYPGDTALQDCIKLLDDSISETRTISHLLHPPLLDEAGLNSAFRWFVEGFGKRSGIDVHLDIHDGAWTVAGSDRTGIISRAAGKPDQRAPAFRRETRRRQSADRRQLSDFAGARLRPWHASGGGAEPAGKRFRRWALAWLG